MRLVVYRDCGVVYVVEVPPEVDVVELIKVLGGGNRIKIVMP
ncbi:MAG: hypothetical protein QXZ56_07965 [Sulfolobales archaeon]